MSIVGVAPRSYRIEVSSPELVATTNVATSGPVSPSLGTAVTDALVGSTRGATGYIPLPGGRVIIVNLPDGFLPRDDHDHGHDHGSDRPSLLGGASVPRVPSGAIAREQAAIEKTVSDVRSFFSGIGIADNEGNDGSAQIRFDPEFPNAAYAPDGAPELGIPADSITVGVDPRSGQSFGRAKDVVAHEWSHRVIDRLTQGTLKMSPVSSDVAIHETLADTLASAFDKDDWQLGEELGKPIRDMKNPESLGHPGHMQDLKQTLAPDSQFVHPARTPNGEVVLLPDWHVVAGVPNKAATIIGDTLGRDAMAKIYVKAARDHIRGGDKFSGLAAAVVRSAQELYGAGSRELQVTRDAWDAVGLLASADRHLAERG